MGIHFLNLARTGYFVSVISYVLFLTLDWLRPGFVSNFLSPHLFLFSAIVFGIIWGSSESANKHQRRTVWLITLPLSVLLAIFAWTEGRAFEDYRLLVALTAFVVPWVVGRLITNGK